MEIRKMKSTDWKEVSSIYLEGIKSNLATFETALPSYNEWDESHLKICRFVAIIDNQIVGWCALSSTSNRYVYRGVVEVSIYLHPSFSGKGIGTTLLNYLSLETEEAGIWTLQSQIMQNNIASIKLHEKCGYRIVGVREAYGQDYLGEWRNVLLMERRKSI